MSRQKTVVNSFVSSFFIAALLLVTQCAVKNNTVSPLPKDILGISIGMSKPDTQRRLEEIAVFETEGRKVGQLWKLKSDPHFSSIAVAYDKEDRVRFVTAFVEKKTAKEKIKFSDVGDLTTSRAEIVEPHYRYIWEIPAQGDESAYVVNIYGDNPEFVDTYSLAKKN